MAGLAFRCPCFFVVWWFVSDSKSVPASTYLPFATWFYCFDGLYGWLLIGRFDISLVRRSKNRAASCGLRGARDLFLGVTFGLGLQGWCRWCVLMLFNNSTLCICRRIINFVVDWSWSADDLSGGRSIRWPTVHLFWRVVVEFCSLRRTCFPLPAT